MSNIRADQRINLGALTRFDPLIDNIVDSATQVSVYWFNAASHEWEKTEVEGSLFVCHRTAAPEYCIVVLNRIKLSNFVEPIGGLELQPRDDGFLFYKDSKANIRGIWFYAPEECSRITKLVQNLNAVMRSREGPAVGSQPSAFTATSNKKTPDIMSLLSKAHSEYDKHGNRIVDKQALVRPKPRRPDIKQDNNNAGAALPVSLDALFAAHSNTPPRGSGPPLVPADTSTLPPMQLLQRLMSCPPPQENSLHAIEKEFKSSLSVPFDDSSSLEKSRSPEGFDSSSVEFNNDASTFRAVIKQESIISTNNIDPIMQLKASTPPPLITPDMICSSPALFTPQDLSRPRSKIITCNGPQRVGANFSANRNISDEDEISNKITPLNSQQMVLAMQYLLNNDPNFVNQLHVAYVKSVKESLGL